MFLAGKFEGVKIEHGHIQYLFSSSLHHLDIPESHTLRSSGMEPRVDFMRN